MDKKPFDHIENRIREAADNSSQYPFEEGAWNNMEAKLGKGNKRRVIAWWWLALPALLISGTGLYWFNHSKDFSNQLAQNSITQQHGNSSKNVNDNTIKPDDNVIASTNVSTTQQVDSRKAIAHLQVSAPASDIILPPKMHASQRKYASKGRTRSHIKSSQVFAATDNGKELAFTPLPNSPYPGHKMVRCVAVPRNSTNSTDKLTVVNDIVKKPTIKKDTTAAVVKAIEVKKKFDHKFYLLAMGGVDAASVDFFSFNNSTVTPRYGVGIGYQLNDRFSIQTGFYASHKEYIAGPGDYKAKAGTYYSTVDITKVAANCLVYDIPVTLRYNFSKGISTTYYASVGLSSFIMKNEAYNYNYIDNNISYQSSKTYTGNQSLFSIFDLSLGIDKKLSDRFSLELEPSVSIPLAGVGAGSVKLYATSLLCGLKYKF